jgi:hypothetical protein
MLHPLYVNMSWVAIIPRATRSHARWIKQPALSQDVGVGTIEHIQRSQCPFSCDVETSSRLGVIGSCCNEAERISTQMSRTGVIRVRDRLMLCLGRRIEVWLLFGEIDDTGVCWAYLRPLVLVDVKTVVMSRAM